MFLEIQKYLKSSNNTFLSLKEEYSIKSSLHPIYPNLVLFKYNQIESPFSEQIVRECRGLILDQTNNWNIVSFPFTKFFNYGELLAAQIDWNTASVQEKLDGSLIILYPYDGKWHVSTSGTPDAGGQVNDFGISFANLFWKIFNENNYQLPSNQDNCFFFELTTPLNKIVVNHTSYKITILGARNLFTLQELNKKEAQSFFPQIPYVKEFPLSNYEEIFKTLPDLNPLNQEGYVVCDSYFNRVKIKSPSYVALHHLKDSCGSSLKNLVTVVISNEIEEVSSALPEYKEQLLNINSKFNSLLYLLEEEYLKIKHIENQKEFALKALKTKCPGALFSIRAGKSSSFKEYLSNINIDNLLSILEIK